MITPSRIFGAIGLTGGLDKSLDSIPSNFVKDGDVAIVSDNLNVYFYILDADSNLDENAPFIIKPDDIDSSVNPSINFKRWILISQKYFVDNIILQLGKYLQTSEIKAIENQPINLISSNGSVITIETDGRVTLNNTTVQGQLTVINGARKPPFIVDSTLRVANLNADKLDGLDADKFSLADGTRPFTGPVQGISPILPGHLTTKGWVEEYILQIQNVIYSYIDDAIANISIIADLANLTSRFNAHVSPSSDDHTQYTHIDGRRNFIGTIGGIDPTLPNHLATKNYIDTAISNIVTVHGNLLNLDQDDHLQYIHKDSRRGFENPIEGKTPVEDFHLATKEYVDERIANIFHTKKLQIHTIDHKTNEWVINHNFNDRYVVIDFYEKFTNRQVKPEKLQLTNNNTAIAFFSENIQGYAVVNGITEHYNFNSSNTWIVEHTFLSKYVIFNVFNTLNEEIFPDSATIVDDTHIAFTFSEPTQGYAVLSNDTTVYNFNIPSYEWNVFHSYNNKNLLANCFTDSHVEIVPIEIEATDDNTLLLTFAQPQTGYVIVSGSEAVILDPGLFIINHNHLRNLDSDDHLQYPNLDGSRGFTGTISGIYPTDDDHLVTKKYVDDEINNALNIEIVYDHNELNGLDQDDHLQYIPVDGSRGFTGTVEGITPTMAFHLTTKQYVDSLFNHMGSNVQKGTVNLFQGADNITVVINPPLSSYVVEVVIENTIDGSPSIYGHMIRRKVTTEFDVIFTGYIDSPNYKLNWVVHPL